jgi:hypothetical protein
MRTVNHQQYERAVSLASTKNDVFVELLQHPTRPLTSSELRRNVRRHPEVWGVYAHWVEVLEEREKAHPPTK